MEPYNEPEFGKCEPTAETPSPLEHIPEQIPAPPEDPVRAARRQFSLTLLSLLFILLVSEVLVTVVYYAIRAAFPSLLELPGAMLVLSSVISYGAAMPLSLLFFRKIPKALPQRRALAFPVFAGLLCLTLLLTLAGAVAGNLVTQILGFLSGSEPENALQELADSSPIWIQLLFFVILAPIFEEIFYRKLIFDRIRTYGELPAILLCGILFGLIHGNFYQFFYAAAVGILFCYVYAKTGRIVYTIGLHMVLNFCGTILTEALDRALNSESTRFFYIGIALFILLAVLFLLMGVLAILYWIKARPKVALEPTEKQLEPKVWASALFSSPVTWIALLFLVLPFFSDFLGSLL